MLGFDEKSTSMSIKRRKQDDHVSSVEDGQSLSLSAGLNRLFASDANPVRVQSEDGEARKHGFSTVVTR